MGMNINTLKNTAIKIYDDVMNTIAAGGNLKTALEKYFTGATTSDEMAARVAILTVTGSLLDAAASKNPQYRPASITWNIMVADASFELMSM